VLTGGRGERAEQLLDFGVVRVKLVQLAEYFLGFLLLSGGFIGEGVIRTGGGFTSEYR
jgi:hypothetical protein